MRSTKNVGSDVMREENSDRMVAYQMKRAIQMSTRKRIKTKSSTTKTGKDFYPVLMIQDCGRSA
jgi:hypothetical protein